MPRLYALFGDLWAKKVPFWVKNSFSWARSALLHGTALYSMVLQCNAWYCMILYGIDLYYIVSNFVYVSA